MEMVVNTGPQNLTKNTTDNHTDSFANHTTVHVMGLSNTEIFSICIYSVILVVGVIGNGLVIFVIGFKMKSTVNSIWFLNLAIADFLYILILILYIIVTFHKMVWNFGDVMCKFTSLVTVLNMFASVFFLTIISLDRCLCSWLVVWAQNKRTLVKARIICVFVWILSICCSIPFVIIRSVQEHDGVKYCGYLSGQNIIDLMSLFIYRFIVGFLIPFIIISSFTAIAVWVRCFNKGNQLQAFRVIISVTSAFFICWLPFHVQQLCYLSAVKYHWSDSIQEKIEAAGSFVLCLAYLNNCLNPILYVFICEDFKKKLKMLIFLNIKAIYSCLSITVEKIKAQL